MTHRLTAISLLTLALAAVPVAQTAPSKPESSSAPAVKPTTAVLPELTKVKGQLALSQVNLAKQNYLLAQKTADEAKRVFEDEANKAQTTLIELTEAIEKAFPGLTVDWQKFTLIPIPPKKIK